MDYHSCIWFHASLSWLGICFQPMLGEVLETQEHSQSLLSYAHVPVKGWVFDKSLTACESPKWIQPVLLPPSTPPGRPTFPQVLVWQASAQSGDIIKKALQSTDLLVEVTLESRRKQLLQQVVHTPWWPAGSEKTAAAWNEDSSCLQLCSTHPFSHLRTPLFPHGLLVILPLYLHKTSGLHPIPLSWWNAPIVRVKQKGIHRISAGRISIVLYCSVKFSHTAENHQANWRGIGIFPIGSSSIIQHLGNMLWIWLKQKWYAPLEMQNFQGQHGTHIPRSASKHAIPSTGNSTRFFGKNYLQPPAHGRVKMLVGGMVTCHTYCNHQLSTVNALLLVKSHSDPLRDKQIRSKKCLPKKNCSPKFVGQCGHFQGPMTSWCGPRKVLASFPMAWFTWLPWWRSTRRASEIHGMDAVPFWIARDTLGWTVYLKAIKKKNRTYPNTQKDVQNISSKQSPRKTKKKHPVHPWPHSGKAAKDSTSRDLGCARHRLGGWCQLVRPGRLAHGFPWFSQRDHHGSTYL